MSQMIEKVCRVCGKDVSNQKRTKDTQGRYYCEPCYADAVAHQAGTTSNSVPDTKCKSCGARVEEDAAFCPRCGAKQEDGMSIQDEIDVTTVIALLRQYAELNSAIAMTPELYRSITEARRGATIRGDANGLAFLDQKFAEAKAQESKCLRECHDIKTRLERFDQERVVKVRDLILVNATVDDSIKNGLRYDVLGMFGNAVVPPTLPTSKTQVASQLSAPTQVVTTTNSTPAEKKVDTHSQAAANRYGWLVGIAVFISIFVLFASTGLLMKYMLLFVFVGLIAIAAGTMAGLFVSDRLSGGVQTFRFGKDGKSPQQFPVGLTITSIIGLIGLILLFLAGKTFIQNSPPTDDDVHFVVVSAIVGLALAIVAVVGFANACPNCHLLFTSEILASDSLGTHMETRRESRVARHYDAHGGPAQAETRYNVDIPVEVTMLLHTKRCKKCGHVWQAKERRES